MEKTQKKAKKNSRSKKNQPLKVVYITNPIKFTTSAAEFRALVQELTGQYADTDAASTYSAEEEAAKVAAEGNLHAEVEEEVMTELGGSSGGGDAAEQDWCDPAGDGLLYDESFVSSIMIESMHYAGTGSNLT